MTTAPEKALHTASNDEMPTGWENLENYGDGDAESGSDYTHHSPLEEVPAVNGNDLLRSRVFFGDAIKLTQKYIPTSSEKALLNLGGIYVLVDKDSNPKKLEATWARAMRGHCDQQITVTDNLTDMVIGSYPLVTGTLDKIPKEILEAEAVEDEAKRRVGDSS